MDGNIYSADEASSWSVTGGCLTTVLPGVHVQSCTSWVGILAEWSEPLGGGVLKIGSPVLAVDV